MKGAYEPFAGLGDGQVVRTRAIRRIMSTVRISPGALLAVKGVPWNPNPARPHGREAAIDVDVHVGRREVAERDLPKAPSLKTEVARRRTYIRNVIWAVWLSPGRAG